MIRQELKDLKGKYFEIIQRDIRKAVKFNSVLGYMKPLRKSKMFNKGFWLKVVIIAANIAGLVTLCLLWGVMIKYLLT